MEMGKPIDQQRQAFGNVQMAPRQARDPNDVANERREINDRDKERLINRIQGYKKKNDLIVDGREHNKMGKDEFLKLLTVQLQNQDPMNPMKQEKMAAELAQFSQLEQLSNLNEKFDGLTKNQQVQDKFYGASFLGKEVVTSGASLKYEGEGTDADILFSLPKPADKVLVRIFDKSNNMVGEMWKENIGRGNQSVMWDGLQLDNSYSAAGEFRTQIFAWDKFADPIEVASKSTGRVESVFFENGETVLKVGGKKVFLRDVDSFHTPGTNEKSIKNTGPQPNINAGRRMASPLNNGSPAAVNNAPKTLPLAQGTQAKVNLNKLNNQAGMNAYKEQAPTTGITSVYDE
ncbi:MAG: flagellar basal-body rod modification protein FlgD [Bacteriovoracaceae bacterium]|jgi:flagellar basal-body rod modification protein FlgD